MNILDKINLLIKKKEEDISFPYKFAGIFYTEEAVKKGVFDDFQKEIRIIEGDKIVEKKSFSTADLLAIKKIDKIPIWDFTKDMNKEDSFEFNEVETLLGIVTEEKLI